MQVKTCPITVKTAGAHEGTEEGIVEAIVAAYNVDSCGDQIIPGAFAKSLERHKAAGNRIPYVWSHKSDDLDSYIGEVIEAEERPEGLWVRAKLDIDEPKAAKAYRLLKGRRVSQFSFAYTEIDARPGTKDGATKELHELEIHECGPTMVGMNQATQLIGVKTAVGSHSTATSDASWDGPAAEKKLPDELTEEIGRAMYAWKDPDGDPTAKSSWKFPHHDVGEGGKPGPANIAACRAVVAALNGARGGSNIPAEDAKSVHAHVAKHLKDAGEDVAPFGGAEKPSDSGSGGSESSSSDSSKADGPAQAPPAPAEDEKPAADPVAMAAALAREISAANKTARALHSALKGDSNDGPGSGDAPKPRPTAPPKPSDSGKAMPDVESAASSPVCTCGARAKGDEPARQGTADLRLRTELALLEAELDLF